MRPSRVFLCEFSGPNEIQTIRTTLASAPGIAAVIDKVLETYLAGKVKIHLDRVRRLGKFLEAEAFIRHGNASRARRKATRINKLFEVLPVDIQSHSCSDLILEDSEFPPEGAEKCRNWPNDLKAGC